MPWPDDDSVRSAAGKRLVGGRVQWHEDDDAVRESLAQARRDLVDPTGWYRFPIAGFGTSGGMRLLDYICWKVQNSADGTAALHKRESFLFAGLWEHYDEEMRLLRKPDRQICGHPVLVETANYRPGELFRCRLPWLAAGEEHFIRKPGGLLWHGWLAVIPPRRTSVQILNTLFQTKDRAMRFRDLPDALRRIFADGPAAAPVRPSRVWDQVSYLRGLGLLRVTTQGGEEADSLTDDLVVRLVPDAMQQPIDVERIRRAALDFGQAKKWGRVAIRRSTWVL